MSDGPMVNKRKRLGLKWRIPIVVLLILVALVAAGPLLLSTRPGNQLLLGIVNDRLDGKIQADRISLSWFGPIRVRDLRVIDPQGRQAASAEQIVYPFGLWRVLTDPQRFEKLHVEQLDLKLYFGADGIPSLARVLARSSGPSQETLSIRPGGDVAVTQGAVALIRPDGRTYALARVDLDLQVSTLSRLSGTINIESADGGEATAEFSATDLFVDGRMDLAGADISVRAATEKPFALGPPLRFTGLSETIDADVSLDGRAQLHIGRWSSSFQLVALQLREQRPDGQVRPPVDIELAGSVALLKNRADGQVAFASDAGRVDASFEYDFSNGLNALTLENILAAIQGGQAIRWPQFALDLDGNIDLAELSRSAPSLLKLLPGTNIQSGRLTAESVQLRGGTEPSLKGRIALSELVAEREGKQYRIRPIELLADAVITAEDGLKAEQIQFRSGFGNLEMAGSRRRVDLTADLDLEGLRRDLGEVFSLGELALAGSLDLQATATRVEDYAELTAKGNCTGLQWNTPRGPIDIGDLVFRHNSSARFSKNRIDLWSVKEFAVQTDLFRLSATGAGGSRRISEGQLTIDQLDLSQAVLHAEKLLDRDLPNVTGLVSGDLSLSRQTATNEMFLSFDLHAEPLNLQNKGQGVVLDWAGISSNGVVYLDEDDHFASINVDLLTFAIGQGISGSGKGHFNDTESFGVELSLADVKLDDVRALLAEFKPIDTDARLDGTLDMHASLSRLDAEKVMRSSGQASISETLVDYEPILPARTELDWRDVEFDTASHVIRASVVTLASEAVRLQARDFAFTPGTTHIEGAGELTADLARCVTAARPFLPEGKLPNVAGVLSAAASFAPTEGGNIVSDGQADLNELKVDDKPILETASRLSWNTLTFNPQEQAFSIDSLSLTSGVLTAGAEKVSFTSRNLQISGVGRLNADLAGCLAAARPFLPEGKLPNLAGRLIANASFTPTGDGKVISNGQANLSELRVDHKTVLAKPSNLSWQALAFDLDAQTFSVDSLSLTSDVLTVVARQVGIAPRDLQIAGDGQLQADLAGCLAVARSLQGESNWPEIAGHLTWRGQASGTGDRVAITGQSRLTDLVIMRTDKGLTLPRVALDHGLTLDRKADTLTVQQFALTSDLLSCRLTGTVQELRSRRVLDLTGEYEGSWEQVGLLIDQLAPDARKSVELTGQTGGPIEITGPASEAEVRPAFRQLQASTDLAWDKARLLGVDFNPAKLNLTLKDGRLVIPDTAVGALEGEVHVGGVVDFEPSSPVYRLDGTVALLDGVRVNEEMGRELLSRFNPVFSSLVELDGLVSMETVDLALPLSEEIKTSGSGHGNLDLQGMTARPSGLLFALLQLGGDLNPNEDTRMEVGRVDFRISNGRIHYDNFTITFPSLADFDVKFYGSVGFDDTLDLIVSVPVRAELLKQLSVQGPILEYARLLEGARLDIPIKGSRENAKLDFSQVDIQPLIRQALQQILQKETLKRIEDIFK